MRANAWYAPKAEQFELQTDKPGNLFTYDEPVRIHRAAEDMRIRPGEKKVLKYKVFDPPWRFGRRRLARIHDSMRDRANRAGRSSHLTERGTFLFHAEIDGWESRETTFCRIPDLAAITHGQPTRLGFTVHAAASTWAIARNNVARSPGGLG